MKRSMRFVVLAGAAVAALAVAPRQARAQGQYVPYQPPAQQPAQPPAYQPPPPAQPPPAYQPPPPAQPAPPPAYQPPPPAYQPPPAQAAPPAYQPPPPAYQPLPATPAVPVPPTAAPPGAPAEAATPPPPEPKYYHPTPSDSRLPWNDHDPWAGAATASLITATNNFFRGPVKGSGGEMGVRFGNDFVGGALGVSLPNNASFIGFDAIRGGINTILFDALLPDVQVGLTFLGVELRYIDGNGVHAVAGKVPLAGLRVTIEDAVKIDLRIPSIGYWKGIGKGDTKVPAGVSWGAELDAGITF